MSLINRWLTAPNIKKLTRKKDFRGLVRALDNPDEKIVQKASHALLDAGSEAIPAMTDELKIKNNRLRKTIVELFAKMGNKDAVPPLLELLQESELLEPHLAAIIALGQIGSSIAIRPLVNLLIRTIQETTWEEANPKFDHQRMTTAVRALVEIKFSLLRMGESAIPHLSAALEHENRLVRLHIARSLGLFGERGVKHLINLLSEGQRSLRWSAAEALDHIDWSPTSLQEKVSYWIARENWEGIAKLGKPATSSLLPFLEDKDDAICQAAAQTLQKIGWSPAKNTFGAMYWANLKQWDRCAAIGSAAAPVLVNVIERILENVPRQIDRQQEINEASSALVQIGEPSIPQALAAMQGNDPQMCHVMAEVLWQIGEPSIPSLLSLTSATDHAVREQAVWALGKLGVENRSLAQRVLPGLNQALNDPASNVSRMAADYLGEIGARFAELAGPAVPVLIAMLKDKVSAVSQQAAISLGMIRDARAVNPLIETLFSQDVSLRVLSARALGAIGDHRAVQPLIQALEDEAYGIQAHAASALGMLEDPKAVEPLIASLTSKEPELRRQAADALGMIKDPLAAKGLVERLHDPNPSVQLAAIKALGRLRSQEALPTLVDTLKSTQNSIQDAAAEAIMKIGGQNAAERLVYFLIHYCDSFVWDPFSPDYDPEGVETGKKTLEKVKNILVAIGEEGLKPLVASLAYSSQRVRKVVSETLQKIGQPAIFELMRTLIHTDRFMRLAAAEELEKLGWKPKKDAIGAAYWIALQKWENCVQLGAVAAEPLIAAFRDPDESIQQKAVESLDLIGWQPPRDAIGVEYWIIKKNWEECAKTGTPAVPPLVRFLTTMLEKLAKEPDHPRYKEDMDGVTGALVKIGEPAIDPLLALLPKGTGIASAPIIEMLCRMGKPASPQLISALNNQDASIRFLAARAIGRIALTEAIKPLIRTLDDPDDRVCREVVIALGNIGDRQAVEPLITRLSDQKEDVRREAAVALGKIGDYRAQQPLIKTLQDTFPGVKIAAAQALSKFADEQAVPALIDTLRREREEVQKAVAEALVAIGGDLVIEMLIELLVGITDSTNWNPTSNTYDLQATLAAGYIQIKTRWALAELAPQSIKPLIDALKGKSDQVRFHIHQTLGMINEQAIFALLRRLEDPQMEWRQMAVEALDDIGWQPGKDLDAAAYWALKQDWKKCAEIGSPAIPVLIRSLTENDDWQRMAAAEALEKTGWQPGMDQEGAVYWIARQEWRKLTDLKDPAIVPLLNALTDFSEQISRGAINPNQGSQVIEQIKNTLAQIGVPAVDNLVDALKDSGKETRAHISTILVKIGTPSIEPLAQTAQEKNPALRLTAAAILGDIQSEKAIDLLNLMLDDPEEMVREQAVTGLAKIGAALRESKLRVGIMETLVEALKDPGSRVKTAAQKALMELDWQGKKAD